MEKDQPEAAMTPYGSLFPKQEANETRSIYVQNRKDIPTGWYGFFELYCGQPGCDCRRVMINVYAQSSGGHVATINYGFDRDDEMAGPFLDPLNRQSRHAQPLLDLFVILLKDESYRQRLIRHYEQMKKAIAAPVSRSQH